MKQTCVVGSVPIIALLLTAGCERPARQMVLSIDDPAHPAAKEVPFLPPPNLLAEPMSPAPASSSAEATVYTCPMHPDVRQNGPGKCPKCGMTLEPAASPAQTGHDHMHEATKESE
jgi:hypothetical protein